MRIFQLKQTPVKGSNHMFSTAKHVIVTHNLVPETVPSRYYTPSYMDMSLEQLSVEIKRKGRK